MQKNKTRLQIIRGVLQSSTVKLRVKKGLLQEVDTLLQQLEQTEPSLIMAKIKELALKLNEALENYPRSKRTIQRESEKLIRDLTEATSKEIMSVVSDRENPESTTGAKSQKGSWNLLSLKSIPRE